MVGLMPSFTCQECGEPFELPQATIDKYPGWEPKYCRAHSRSKGKSTEKVAVRRSSRGRQREENLTVAQVLDKYSAGPDDGVFTDGSSVPNPGPGGWGAVWVQDGQVAQALHGYDGDTTNNRMELTALIEAYKMLPIDAQVTLYTDSRLCVDTITKWAPGWERKGWKKKGGEIKNLELVQELLALFRTHPECSLEWIAAHAGNRWNEYADSLAMAWRRETV